MGKLATREEALGLILERARPLGSERVRLEEAQGRVLAEAVLSTVDLPPFASSAMDGFAVRAIDTPGTLRVTAHIAAGSPAGQALGPGEAMGISTGAVVPEGADAVVPVEVVVQRDNSVQIEAPASSAAHIRPRGGDVRVGEPVLPAGARIGPAQLGALAAIGCAELGVSRRPQAAVVTTGTELRRPGEPLGPGQIYEANGVMIAAQLGEAGATVALHPPVADDARAHRAVLEQALAGDLVVSSGGVSVGRHDLIRPVEAELGVEEVFWGVAVKPGKPLLFGVRGETLVFGLPGNPVSSLVAFELFVRPAVLALQGVPEPGPTYARGTLAVAVRKDPRREQLLRARRSQGCREVLLHPLLGQDSHMIARAALADALVLVRAGNGELEPGEEVEYLRLGG